LPRSDRLEFRLPSEADVELVCDASTDRLIPLITSVEANSTPKQALDFVTRQLGRPTEGSGWSLTIVDRATATPVGNAFVSCHTLDLGGITMGYWIGPSHRGHGYAGEALTVLRDWAPTEFAIDRMTLFIDPENIASLRTAERAGFVNESLHENFELVGTEFRPMTQWGHGPGAAEPVTLGVLERHMWLDEYRGDSRWFDHHLHDDFVEHGCSGKLWTREEIIATPLTEIQVALPLSEQHVRRISDDTWMLTYTAVQPHRTCRRMSLWQVTAGGWGMRFHQGTPI